MVLGASRTAVFPPLSLVVDLAQYPSHQSGTYWAAGEGRWVSAARSSSSHLNCRLVPDWMDAVFTNLVVRPLPGALWWAAWCIENRVLIHTRQSNSHEQSNSFLTVSHTQVSCD